jgi:plastocyanin
MRSFRSPFVVLAAIVGATALAVPSLLAGDAAAGSVKTVVIEDIDFTPRSVTIGRGGVVRWKFADGVTPHNVASRGKPRFRSSSTKTSGTYSVRFSKAGTYRYVCTIHLNMKARVVVR